MSFKNPETLAKAKAALAKKRQKAREQKAEDEFKELKAQIRKDPELKKLYLSEKGKKSFTFFCNKILGFSDMIMQGDELVPGYGHESLCRYIQHDASLFKLILTPRFTFKSHVSTIGKCLWLLANDPNIRILICSDTNEKAEGFLSGVKNHIEGKIGDSLFRSVYGNWAVDSKKGTWNQQAIVIKPRTKAQVEPSIDTAGLETSKTGKHYDVIIFDDLVSEKNITTPEQMLKVKDVYKKYLSVLKPGGEIQLVGTRWHFGDLYGAIVAEEDERSKSKQLSVFSTFIRAAEVTQDGKTVYPYSKMGENSLTKDRLALLKSEQGSYVYSALYMNNPVDDENAKFKQSDFVFYDPTILRKKSFTDELFITCCLDPIPPHESTKGDDAALTVVGTDSDWNMYVLDIIAGRLQPSEQIDELFGLFRRWNFRTLGIETNHWQKTLLPDIEVYLAKERRNPHFRMFHVEKITRNSGNSKHKDIFGLQPYHERHAIKFPGTRCELLTGNWQKLMMQMLQYPNGQHDDVLDSLSMHLQIRRPGNKVKEEKEIPYTSAAWFELEQRKQEKQIQRRTPRWRRRELPQLTFS